MSVNLTATFNDYDLSSYLIINSLTRGIGLTRTSRIQSRKKDIGVQYVGFETESLTFKMEISIVDQLIFKRRQLAKILNVSEPQKLIFSDEPDIYYLAFPKLEGDLSEIYRLGQGVLQWEIFDGVGYSTELYMFDNKATENYIEIDNPGTEPMLFELEVTFLSDNGFLGLQNDVGTTKALFGTIEEVDGVHYETTDLLFDDHFTQDRGWILNQGITPPVTPVRIQDGTVRYAVETPGEGVLGEGYVTPNGYGTGDSWHGPSLTKLVPADKNGKYPTNWYSCYRLDFNTDGGGTATERGRQAGHHSVTFSDANDNIIVSIVFEDNNYALERSDMVIYIGNKRVWDTKNTTSFYVRGHEGRPDGTALVQIEKIGTQVNVKFSFAGINKTFTVDTPSAELRKITYYGAQYKTYTPIRNNLLRAIQVRKHNVTNWNDIPNKFGEGDTLRYGKDGQNIYCTANGLQGLQFRDPGSTLITAPPGHSTMFIAYSDFSEPPIITLKGRAMYV